MFPRKEKKYARLSVGKLFQRTIFGPMYTISNAPLSQYWCYIPGVAKLLDGPCHFSKFEIFREPQLNSYLKGIKKITEIIFIEHM